MFDVLDVIVFELLFVYGGDLNELVGEGLIRMWGVLLLCVIVVCCLVCYVVVLLVVGVDFYVWIVVGVSVYWFVM